MIGSLETCCDNFSVQFVVLKVNLLTSDPVFTLVVTELSFGDKQGYQSPKLCHFLLYFFQFVSFL